MSSNFHKVQLNGYQQQLRCKLRIWTVNEHKIDGPQRLGEDVEGGVVAQLAVPWGTAICAHSVEMLALMHHSSYVSSFILKTNYALVV
jgi:predicted cupin superfamily sugar epimerase